MPVVNLDDGGTYHASTNQRKLYDCFTDFCKEIGNIKADRKIGVLVGDIGELDTKRRTVQLVTLNKATILNMMLDTLEPFIDIMDQIVVIRGTMAHVGKSSWLEEKLASDLDNTIRYNDKVASFWHFRRVFDGVRFDIAHHQTMGGIPRTEKSYIDRQTYDTIWRYMWDMNQKPPHLIWRADQHRYVSSGDKWHNFHFKVTGVAMPCFQIKTEWIYRIGHENDNPHVGGVYALCEGGDYIADKILYNIQPRKIWTEA